MYGIWHSMSAATNNLQFGGSDDSGSDFDADDATLPFPKPLDRSTFLASDFDATAFLSSLSNRFQTLEDLQTELRELNQSLNKELVDLVNDNYQDFLSLGQALSGGEERIEDIRVGLLAFQRDIKSVRDKIETRRNEAAELLEQKRALKQEISVGRALLEIAERLDELEEKLGLGSSALTPAPETEDHENGNDKWGNGWTGIQSDGSDDDDDYDDDEDSSGVPSKLRRRVEQLRIVKILLGRHSPQHPFLLAEQERVRKVQETILLDLDAAIKQEPDVKIKQQILRLRSTVDE